MEVLFGKSLTNGPFSIAMFDYQRVNFPYMNPSKSRAWIKGRSLDLSCLGTNPNSFILGSKGMFTMVLASNH